MVRKKSGLVLCVSKIMSTSEATKCGYSNYEPGHLTEMLPPNVDDGEGSEPRTFQTSVRYDSGIMGMTKAMGLLRSSSGFVKDEKPFWAWLSEEDSNGERTLVCWHREATTDGSTVATYSILEGKVKKGQGTVRKERNVSQDEATLDPDCPPEMLSAARRYRALGNPLPLHDFVTHLDMADGRSVVLHQPYASNAIWSGGDPVTACADFRPLGYGKAYIVTLMDPSNAESHRSDGPAE